MAQGIATLPASAALLAFNPVNYLKYVDEDVDTHGLLMANGDPTDPLSALCRLEVVPARSGNGRVHIRCTYNNKFLALRSETGDDVVAPVADEPVEDVSTWRCTMFVPSHAVGGITLLHAQSGRHVLIADSNNPVPTLSAQAPPPSIFLVTDLGPLFRMPSYVAFKGHNGQYLQFFVNNPGDTYVQLRAPPAAADKWDTALVHQVDLITYMDSRYRIKCHASNMGDGYWRRNHVLPQSQFIHPDAGSRHDLVNRSDETYFRLAKVGESDEGIIVTFRTVWGGANYVIPATSFSVLSVLAPEVVPEARFVVEEAVRSRLIYNVRFNLLDARVFSDPPVDMTGQDFTNSTSLTQKMELTFTYTKSQTSTWNATVSTTVGVSTTFRTGVPFIADGEISTSIETTAAYEWGKSYMEEETRSDRIEIDVAPMTRVRVTRWETKGSCDVPFFYTAEDTLFNWEKKEYTRDDGLYKGVNSFNIHYVAVETPLNSDDPSRVTKTYPVFPVTSEIVSSVDVVPAA